MNNPSIIISTVILLLTFQINDFINPSGFQETWWRVENSPHSHESQNPPRFLLPLLHARPIQYDHPRHRTQQR